MLTSIFILVSLLHFMMNPLLSRCIVMKSTKLLNLGKLLEATLFWTEKVETCAETTLLTCNLLVLNIHGTGKDPDAWELEIGGYWIILTHCVLYMYTWCTYLIIPRPLLLDTRITLWGIDQYLYYRVNLMILLLTLPV